MSSTLSNILDEIVNLLEGSSGTIRAITANTFKHFSDSDDFAINYAIEAPYPFFMNEPKPVEVEDVPGNVSGDYHYDGKNIEIVFVYTGMPFDRKAIEKTIADNEKTIKACFSHPLNWTSIDNWCGCELEFDREAVDIGEEEGNVIAEGHLCTMTITYREDLSS